MLLTRTCSDAVIANITALATSSGFNLGIYLTNSLSDPSVVRISFSTKPGLMFCNAAKKRVKFLKINSYKTGTLVSIEMYAKHLV